MFLPQAASCYIQCILCDHLFILLGHYSVVSIDLKQEATGAKLSLLQTEVPEAECERTKEGWRRHIFEPIKSTFGFGAHLL